MTTEKIYFVAYNWYAECADEREGVKAFRKIINAFISDLRTLDSMKDSIIRFMLRESNYIRWCSFGLQRGGMPDYIGFSDDNWVKVIGESTGLEFKLIEDSEK